jgi:hypothetical protein
MKKILLSLSCLMLAVIACGTPVQKTATPSPTLEAPTADPALLWYLMRGEAKSDQIWGVDTDSKGNIYAAGYFQSPASKPFFDIVMYKFAPDGNEIWRSQWGDQFEQKGFIVVVEQPYVYIGGTTRPSISLSESDMAVLCLNMDTGAVIWEFTWDQGFGYEEVDGVVVETDAIYVSGWTTGETSSNDIAILKLDLNGKLQWVQTWGDAGYDTADGQIVVDEDAIYISGRYNGTNILFGGQAVLVKFDKTNGNYLKHSLWGSSFFSDGLGSTSDGTYIYVTGLNIQNGNGQIFLLKYDKNLNLQWAQEWGDKAGESARVVEVDGDGNIIIGGSTFSYGAGESDVVLLKYLPDGTLQWYKTWGGPLADSIQGMAIDDGFVYLVGSSENGSQGMSDGLLIKADLLNGRFPTP